jgi:serine-type D-Ala-D-Ala carboxypeptidase/endopeptidase (penicillin-binding protein 4)
MRAALFWVVFALASAAIADDYLPPAVLQGLRQVGIPASSVGVVVQEVGAPRASLALNAAQPKNPASVMKLVTTLAALELLGSAYRWKTEVYLDGDNVVLRGYGDPKLNYESFWMLLRAVRGRGIRDIRGDVLLDRSFFGPVADGRVDNETFRPYNVVPDALLVNFKSLRFTFIPDSQRAAVHVFADPALPGMELVNQLKLSQGICPEGRAFRDMVQASFQSRPPRAAFTGSYPSTCGERDLNVALYEPEDYVAGMIRQLWAEMGGTWSGAVRTGVVPASARLVYVHDSDPLGEIVRDINKFSNNVMARQLFLTLAAELTPARGENAQRAVRDWLTRKGISAPEFVIENGSGLSRNERISPASLAALLQAAWRGPLMPEFVASLPLVAADGTMRKRLRGEPIAGNAHIKTGLLSDARSIAGFVQDRAGRRYVVVAMINHPRAPEADAALDALLKWTYEGGGAAKAPARSTMNRRGVSQRRP